MAIPSSLTSTYVVGAVGNDVLLDCRLPATGILANISTEWFLSRPSELIQIISYNGSTGEKIQNKRYWGQKELLQWVPSRGIFPLLLKDIQVSDAGIYICLVSSGKRQHEEAFELDVI